MYLLLLNGRNNRQMRICSTEYKDVLDCIIDEVPDRIYKLIQDFMWNSEQEVLQLPDKYGIVRVVMNPEKLYAKYQLEWMINRGYSIKNLICCLDNIKDEYEESDGVVYIDTISDLYNEWVCEYGFNGEIWSCYDEWCHNELFDMFDM